jgi:hypothetical protein
VAIVRQGGSLSCLLRRLKITIPKCNVPLIFAGQQLTILTMIYTYNMAAKLVLRYMK